MPSPSPRSSILFDDIPSRKISFDNLEYSPVNDRHYLMSLNNGASIQRRNSTKRNSLRLRGLLRSWTCSSKKNISRLVTPKQQHQLTNNGSYESQKSRQIKLSVDQASIPLHLQSEDERIGEKTVSKIPAPQKQKNPDENMRRSLTKFEKNSKKGVVLSSLVSTKSELKVDWKTLKNDSTIVREVLSDDDHVQKTKTTADNIIRLVFDGLRYQYEDKKSLTLTPTQPLSSTAAVVSATLPSNIPVSKPLQKSQYTHSPFIFRPSVSTAAAGVHYTGGTVSLSSMSESSNLAKMMILKQQQPKIQSAHTTLGIPIRTSLVAKQVADTNSPAAPLEPSHRSKFIVSCQVNSNQSVPSYSYRKLIKELQTPTTTTTSSPHTAGLVWISASSERQEKILFTQQPTIFKIKNKQLKSHHLQSASNSSSDTSSSSKTSTEISTTTTKSSISTTSTQSTRRGNVTTSSSVTSTVITNEETQTSSSSSSPIRTTNKNAVNRRSVFSLSTSSSNSANSTSNSSSSSATSFSSFRQKTRMFYEVVFLITTCLRHISTIPKQQVSLNNDKDNDQSLDIIVDVKSGSEAFVSNVTTSTLH
ncbi:unnamed protein product, partial [Didymodactylos carnosus]